VTRAQIIATAWGLVHLFAAAIAITPLGFILLQIILTGNYTYHAQAATVMPAREVLSMLLAFGVLTASAIRGIYLTQRQPQ
jgi:hypothetical protein